MNNIEYPVDEQLQQAIHELGKHIKEPGELLNAMVTWITEKQVYLKEGIQ